LPGGDGGDKDAIMAMVDDSFFARDACEVARDLVGKVLRRRLDGRWLSAAIVEAEAYYQTEQGSHASQGRTPSRESLFQPAGTIYMYHSRAGDSLNVSCGGAGNAVLFKSGRPFVDAISDERSLAAMRSLNPRRDGSDRDDDRLCAGQTLLCRALSLKIRDWDGLRFDRAALYVDDAGYTPAQVAIAPRLGIPAGRDEHLPYRYLDVAWAKAATANPLRKRGAREGVDYRLLAPGERDPNAGGPSIRSSRKHGVEHGARHPGA
jgi:DNA-3-methyladenine glycosylase